MSLLVLYNQPAAGGNTVTVVTGHLVLTGKVLTVSQTGHHYIDVVTGHLVLTGKVLTVSRTEHKTVDVVTGHLVLTGKVLTVTQTLQLTLTVQQAQRLDAIFRRHGLIDPLVITPTSISDGTLTMTRAWNGTTETDTVTALPAAGAPTAALIDKLADHFGLHDSVAVTASGRVGSAGLEQTFAQVGDNITVTTL